MTLLSCSAKHERRPAPCDEILFRSRSWICTGEPALSRWRVWSRTRPRRGRSSTLCAGTCTERSAASRGSTTSSTSWAPSRRSETGAATGPAPWSCVGSSTQRSRRDFLGLTARHRGPPRRAAPCARAASITADTADATDATRAGAAGSAADPPTSSAVVTRHHGDAPGSRGASARRALLETRR